MERKKDKKKKPTQTTVATPTGRGVFAASRMRDGK